jgi:hypothetical protein
LHQIADVGETRQLRHERIGLRGLPRFVTASGAYTFLPSLPAIRYLAALAGQVRVPDSAGARLAPSAAPLIAARVMRT